MRIQGFIVLDGARRIVESAFAESFLAPNRSILLTSRDAFLCDWSRRQSCVPKSNEG